MKNISTKTKSPTPVNTMPVIARNMAILPRTRAPSQSRAATVLDDMANITASKPANQKHIE